MQMWLIFLFFVNFTANMNILFPTPLSYFLPDDAVWILGDFNAQLNIDNLLCQNYSAMNFSVLLLTHQQKPCKLHVTK